MISQDAVPLACSDTGNGPAVLILHGLLGDKSNWRRTARKLSQAYRVICADARNHGDSPAAGSMDYRRMAADAAALLAGLGVERAIVLGHSMGGKTAMTLALARPALVAALVAVDIAPAPSGDRFDALLAALQRVPLAGIASRSEADARLAGSVADPGLRSFLLKNLARGDEGFHWRIDLDAIRSCLPEVIDFPEPAAGAAYRGPALFVRGADSGAVTPEHRPRIERLFPAARIETVAGAGHWPHAEAPEAFAAILDDFLDSLPAG